jgi:hypothetical protein
MVVSKSKPRPWLRKEKEEAASAAHCSSSSTSGTAASFFLVWGCCVLINAVVLNPAANLEHKFAGFVILTIGAWLALLTLAGARAGQAAARAERFLRGLFF